MIIENLRSNFEMGNYERVVELSGDGIRINGPDDTVAIVGSFCYLGRLDEGQGIFNSQLAHLSGSQIARCRLFIGTNLARQMRYKQAAHFFIENMRSAKFSDDPAIHVCAHLGWAFFRLCHDRSAKALRSVKFALTLSSDARDGYLKVIALDMKAHCLHKLGLPCEALFAFNQALKASTSSLGNGGIRRAISASVAIHSSRYGYSENAHEMLEECLASDESSDSYTRARLLIELGRRHILRGELDQAEQYLRSGFQLAHGFDQPWFLMHLNLVKANISFLAGDFEFSKESALNAKQLWLGNSSFQPGIEIFSLLEKIAKIQGNAELIQLCNSKVNELSRKTSDLIGKRIAARLHSESTKFAFGQDPIGDLIDAIDRKEPGIAARIKTSGLFSLFRRLYRIPETEKKVVVFDGSINCLALFDRGNVLVSDIGKGGMIVDSLRLLSKTLCTKADIVMRIWGYTYHPFKHDPLVYRLTSRLRDSLGSRSDWLKYTENGYILDAVFVSLENCDDSTSKMVADSNGFLSTAPRSFSRPQMILDLARQLGGVLTSKIVSQRLGCAEITARRDLHSLLKEGKLERLGNGRSTQYQLVNNIMKGNHQ